MEASKSSPKNNESLASRIAKEEHFISQADIKKDLNAVFIEENPQKALEKILTLSNNGNYQEKLQYIRHLADLLDLIGQEAIDNLNKIISFVNQDRDDTKRALMSQTESLIAILQKRGEKGYQQIVNVLLPVISGFLNSTQYTIKEEAGSQLAKIGEVLTEDDRGKHLLTRILGMGHDDESEENRTIAARLLSQMAPLFGKDLCEQFVGFEFLAMGEDPEFRVRKEAVINLHSIGKVVSANFFRQKLLIFYFKLCRDNHWGVRQACVEALYEIASICKGELGNVKENEMTEAMLTFLKDTNKFVKISAYKALGPFISTLQGLKVNERLVENYLRMTEPVINNLGPDNEIIHSCSYNFPAVVLTLGATKWFALLKLFQTLLKQQDKIRRPLAYSLHDIAKIIGEERAERDLFNVLVSFLKDKNDDIKFGAIQNLTRFFKVFPVEKREHMIDILLDLQKDQKKWRIRELIARQIEELTIIFPAEISFKIITPISFKLCNDPVAIVREEASRHIYSLLKALDDSEVVYRESVIENIKGFSLSNRYTTRQAYVIMCEKIMEDAELFKNHFLDFLMPLADDKVPNVRIALAKTVLKIHDRKGKLAKNPQIIKLIQKLKNDRSKDVKNVMQDIELPAEFAVAEAPVEAIKEALVEVINENPEGKEGPVIKEEEVVAENQENLNKVEEIAVEEKTEEVQEVQEVKEVNDKEVEVKGEIEGENESSEPKTNVEGEISNKEEQARQEDTA